MANFIKAALVSEIVPGSMKTVNVDGKTIAIANVDGEFFAVDDACTHAQCSLGAEGSLSGNIVTCGCHGAQFDVKSGKVLTLPAPTDLTPYEIKVENGEVYIKI